MTYMEAYKRLEKLCGDLLNDDRKISAYIDEMQKLSKGAMFVPGWEEDLRQLKHYRWVRNQIAHNPECTEETICGAQDTEWILGFYERIMQQTDPLALFHQKRQQDMRPVQKLSYPMHKRNSEAEDESDGFGFIVLCCVAAVAFFALFVLLLSGIVLG